MFNILYSIVLILYISFKLFKKIVISVGLKNKNGIK